MMILATRRRAPRPRRPPVARLPTGESALEAAFDFAWFAHRPAALAAVRPVKQYRFHATRKWRFDRAFVEARVAVELDGGTYNQGRHVRGAGFERDLEKLNAAALAGWLVLRYTTTMLRRDPKGMVDAVCQALVQRGVGA